MARPGRARHTTTAPGRRRWVLSARPTSILTSTHPGHRPTATATSASAAINVAAKDGDATVVIKAGNSVVQNGGNVAFANNAVTTVTVTVTNGDAENVYTIEVTRGNP